MCAGCALAAASAATGFRTWLQTRGFTWLTPARLKALTVTAMVIAGLVSTIGLTGSSTPTAHATKPAAHVASAPR